jgi:hypothetical protein
VNEDEDIMSASTHACLVAAAAVPAHPRTKRMTTPMRRVGRPYERNDRDADADADDSARGGERTRWRTGEEKRTAERGWRTRRGDSKEVGQRGERGGRVASG